MAQNSSLPGTLAFVGGGTFFLLNIITDGAVPGGGIGGAIGGAIGYVIGSAISSAQAKAGTVPDGRSADKTTTDDPRTAEPNMPPHP